MNKKHTVNKFSDAMNFRRGKKLFEELFKKYNIEGLTLQDKMLAFGEYIQSHNGVEKLETALPKIDVENCDLDTLDITSTKPRCRFVPIKKIIDTSDLTARTCEICKNIRQEMAQLENILGKKLRSKEYGSLIIMAKKREGDQAIISSLENDVIFFKRELDNKNDEFKRELGKRDDASSRLTKQVNDMSSQIRVLTSQESKTTNLRQVIGMLEKTVISLQKDKKALLEQLEET